MCNQVLTYPPNILKALAKIAFYSNLDLCCLGRCGSAALWERQCCGSSLALPHLTDCWDQEDIYTFSSPSNGHWVQLDHSLLQCLDNNSLPLSLTPLEPLNLLPLIPLQIHESLSLQTASESSPNYSSSPRALGSCSRWWIMFITLRACS
jgi:hypothetical protein